MATLYKRGDCYYINWRHGSRQYRRSLGKIDERAAEKVRREKAAELTLGIERVDQTASPTLAEWLDDYCDWQEIERKSKKRRSELKRVRERLGQHRIATLPARLVEEYKIERLRTASAETVGKEIRILKAALNRAVALGVIEKNPAAKIAAPRGVRSKAVEFYTKAQLAKLYKADMAAAPIWRFLANTGLRRAEFVKARRSDIVGGHIRVESTEEGRTKSGKWRQVPLNASAKAALRLLGRDELSPYAADTLTHWFAATAAAAGLAGNLHMLRHTFCSHLVMAGVPLRTVQVLAGHSSYSITEQYAHLAPKVKTEAVAKINL